MHESFLLSRKLLHIFNTHKRTQGMIILTCIMLTKVWQVDYAIGWNLYTMKILGIWPEERRFDRISSYKVLIGTTFILLFCTIPQSLHLYFVRGDFELVMDNLSLDSINCACSFVKMITFWANGRQIKDLLIAMEQDWKEVTIEEEEKEMTRIAKFSRNLTSTITAICLSLIVFYVMSVCSAMHAEGQKILLLSSWFPYDITITPNYELTFICQLIGCTYYSVSYTAVDTFLAMLILHICGQLLRLRNGLTNLHSATKQEFQTKLSYLVSKHDRLNKYVDMIDGRFNIMLLIQMMSCTLQLCMECFQGLLGLADENESMTLLELCFLGLYIGYVLLQLYLYCYVGEKLWFESSEVAQAAYECKWYDLLPEEGRPLVLIIRRARTPMCLTAGKICTFNHELYSSVLKTSMSYLSVLRATITNN